MKMIRSTVGADNAGRPLYWSDSDGWVTKENADTFEEDHIALLFPPEDGEVVDEWE